MKMNRRQTIRSLAGGGLILPGLLSEMLAAEDNPLAPKKPHFTPKAKRVIFCCMRGGPSHVDTFDHKPSLVRDEGKQLPKFRNRELMPSPWAVSYTHLTLPTILLV